MYAVYRWTEWLSATQSHLIDLGQSQMYTQTIIVYFPPFLCEPDFFFISILYLGYDFPLISKVAASINRKMYNKWPYLKWKWSFHFLYMTGQ